MLERKGKDLIPSWKARNNCIQGGLCVGDQQGRQGYHFCLKPKLSIFSCRREMIGGELKGRGQGGEGDTNTIYFW